MLGSPTQPSSQPGGAHSVPVSEATLRHRQELGLLGKLFGGRDHAPINIAGTIIVLGIVALVASPMLPESQSFTHGDLAKSLGGLILAALTFLGGYLGGGGAKDH